MIIGAHVSISDGIENSPKRGRELGLDAIQIFTKNQRQWIARPLQEKEIKGFKENVKKYKIKAVAHDSYLINLASFEDEKWSRAKESFLDETQRCEALGIGYLIFHPGAHMGHGEEFALKRIANAMEEVLDKTDTVNLLLETTAGQGSNVGYKFEHMTDIIDHVSNKKRVGVCVDTCHIYAAGYDIVNSYEKVMDEFDQIIGLGNLKVMHLNDSEKGLGSRIDRHAHIGKGLIGNKGFKNVLNDKRLKAVPMILETPQGEEEYYLDILAIRTLL